MRPTLANRIFWVAAFALSSWTAGASLAFAQADTPAVHFERGINLFNEGRYDAALAEFNRAYELEPAFQVLYNLGRVHAALGHAVEATHAYQRYLDEGGRNVPAARQREVREALATQRSRIGRIQVVTDVRGAVVNVDGNDVATTPLSEPIEVTAGSHTVEVRGPGYEPVRRAVQIAGGVLERVEVALSPSARGQVRIECATPDTLVTIDEREVGRTPFESTVGVESGDHRLVATRPGYQPFERQFHVAGGAEVQVAIDMRRDLRVAGDDVGTLELRLPSDVSFLAHVDGEPMSQERTLRLPSGRHRVDLEVAERIPWTGTIVVPRGESAVLAPPLEWTPDARSERVSSARSRRVAGIALAFPGFAALVAGGVMTIVNETAIPQTDADLIDVHRRYVMNGCVVGDLSEPCASLESRFNELSDQQSTQDVVRWVGIGLIAAGGLASGVGLYLWLGAKSEDDVDREARASLSLSPTAGGASATFRLSL